MDNHLESLLQKVRTQSEHLCAPLATEDYVIQAMPDVSPIKWHLAHVTWFFETFVLLPYLKNYPLFDSHYHYLFNSYYEAVGPFCPQNKRGIFSRPSVAEIYDYRHYVDKHLSVLLTQTNHPDQAEILSRLRLGIEHEQQHQELLLMDIKFNFASNPMRPTYCRTPAKKSSSAVSTLNENSSHSWTQYAAGIYTIGFKGEGFAFDNEKPSHEVYLTAFTIKNALISNAEYLDFVEAGGYQQPRYWLADGWKKVQREQWQAPLYWENHHGNWYQMTLRGFMPLIAQEPVCHVSYYEADAYARFAQARLPSEAEWEIVAADCEQQGNFLESGHLHPVMTTRSGLSQFFGDVWEWTTSAYIPYPGFQPFAGVFSEYNGKFACNQMVLRGGCAVTPQSHARLTYRNFYYPHQRWPFTGIRLAADV